MKFYLTLVLLCTSCLTYSQEVYNQELNYIFSVKVVDTTLYVGEVLELTVDNPVFQKGDANYISAVNAGWTILTANSVYKEFNDVNGNPRRWRILHN